FLPISDQRCRHRPMICAGTSRCRMVCCDSRTVGGLSARRLMLIFIVARLASTLPVLFGLSLAVFVMLRVAPGDPVALMLGQDADAATIAQLRASLGIDQPVPVQYVRWLGGVVQGDFGRSLRSHQPVFELVFRRMPVTPELAILAQLVALA